MGSEKSELPEGTRIFGAVQRRLSRKRAKHAPDEVFLEFKIFRGRTRFT